ncbi:MAG: phosphatidate cytidylyltransferase [Paludibacteraceae bacterium]|nr:phosphatidate cytidylyltransferase [Paludibacteraceae bacterium]
MTEFGKRTLSGAVYVAVVVGSIVWKVDVFAVLSGILAFLAVREFNRLTHPRCLMDIYSELAATALVLAVYCLAGNTGLPVSLSMVALYAVLLLLMLVSELWDKNTNPITVWGNILIGQTMIALPFALMNVLGSLSPWLLLAVFVLIWVNDSGAYCVGSLTARRKGGNHKMFPRVSPKKSWEGLTGGIVLAMATSILPAHFGWFDPITQLNGYVAGALFALIVSVSGTLGDLMESLFKRSLGVKDSGKFLPGHGGVLDRFDSLLLAVPAVLVFLLILAAV